MGLVLFLDVWLSSLGDDWCLGGPGCSGDDRMLFSLVNESKVLLVDTSVDSNSPKE